MATVLFYIAIGLITLVLFVYDEIRHRHGVMPTKVAFVCGVPLFAAAHFWFPFLQYTILTLWTVGAAIVVIDKVALVAHKASGEKIVLVEKDKEGGEHK
jgi:hypothetical protein